MGNVLSQCIAGLLFESSHHIIFTDIEFPGEGINPKITGQMIVDVTQNVYDLSLIHILYGDYIPCYQLSMCIGIERSACVFLWNWSRF